MDAHIQAAAQLATALADLDPRLELWKAPDRMAEPIHGAYPGFWHVVVNSTTDVPDTYLVISTNGLGVEGDFREPDFGVLESLKRNDMQGRHYSLPTDDYDAVEEAVKKERARKKEQKGDQIKEDFSAAMRVPGDAGLEKRLWAKGAKKL